MRFTIDSPSPVPLIDFVNSFFARKNSENYFFINFFITRGKQQIKEYLSVHYSSKKYFPYPKGRIYALYQMIKFTVCNSIQT